MDADLRLLVEPRTETGKAPAAAQPGVEVTHFDAQVKLAASLAPANGDPQESPVPSLPGDEEPSLDPPGDRRVLGAGVVTRGAEPKQGQPPGREHDGARVLGVDDPDQAQRDPRQIRPVGPGQALQVLGPPQLL